MNVTRNTEKGMVDHGALKSNQLIIITLSLIAFIADLPPVAMAVALVMAAGTMFGKPGFLPVHVWILRPLGLVKTDLLPDNPSPHRFAQGFGSLVMLSGAVALFSGAQLAGWILVWLVIFLAAINVSAGFCAGCFMYYQLGRLGLPGFSQNLGESGRAGFKPVKEEAVHE
ncbi:MAG: DUF4395 domain-containing protein [Spirochaetota bacterium]